ncbi:DUF1499 domain-containing protein [Anaerobacillus alkaliphilus]|uniref:DUF1499 domain-containing protein n=1 Tax=Anaerobacillus alkaliphilus TaxID=1548597 RepID=A0A4Q0VPU4_9BACI|nr:DUF1499 domain-containing protein [Anaerobacillus alkaliphilus]RXI98512.1 DUF1499 domain-containing protein [Anaerobacillus alkaliphilus]
MGFKETINKYFSTHTETAESHYDEALKTRYYKAMKDKAFNEVLTLLHKTQGFQVKSNSIDRGEIIVEGKAKKKFFLVATIIMVSPNRTAVDFAVTTETALPLDFGFSASVIKEVYKKIDKHLEYVGSGLGA